MPLVKNKRTSINIIHHSLVSLIPLDKKSCTIGDIIHHLLVSLTPNNNSLFHLTYKQSTNQNTRNNLKFHIKLFNQRKNKSGSTSNWSWNDNLKLKKYIYIYIKCDIYVPNKFCIIKKEHKNCDLFHHIGRWKMKERVWCMTMKLTF